MFRTIPTLPTVYTQVVHRSVDIFFSLLFPHQTPYAEARFYRYFPDNYGTTIQAYEDIKAITVFDEPIKELIHRAKYNGETVIAKEMGYLLAQNVFLNEYDAIMYVPSDPVRRVLRGYHIPQVIAQSLSTHLNIPCLNLVSKIKHTQSQTELNKKEREENLKHVFYCKKVDIKGKKIHTKILLIDDTVTTGSSLRSVRDAALATNPLLEIDMWAIAAAPLE